MPYILSSPSNHIDRKITENKTLILWQHIEQDFNTYYIEKVTKIRKLKPKTSEDSSYYSRPFKGKPMNVFRSVTVAEVKESKRNYQGFWYQNVYGRSNSF